MIATPAWPRFLPRWLAFIGLLLLLTFVFSSQLYWSGYVTPWTKAFREESAYWFAWGVLAPALFWMCRRLISGGHAWKVQVLSVLAGAVLASVLQPLISFAGACTTAWLAASIASTAEPPLFRQDLLASMLRNAGINLPVYAGFALAWYAATYYRALRDRELRAVELESLLHQAQLQALRNQLSPHFLFNTLHSIAELVHENPKLAEQLILRLGELLRQALTSSQQPELPLADELAFTRGYVDIEQMRLGERLQVQWDVDPAALQVRVPSLILQPLVENAVQHGVAPLTQTTSLAISARRDDQYLYLRVRDSGPGLSGTASSRGSGIGLSNTKLRLQRLYGERQAFELGADNGLVVNIRIPVSTP